MGEKGNVPGVAHWGESPNQTGSLVGDAVRGTVPQPSVTPGTSGVNDTEYSTTPNMATPSGQGSGTLNLSSPP